MGLRIVAIVPAAGLGERFGSSEKKQFVKIAGKPLLIYSLQRLNETREISEIIPVLRQEDMGAGRGLIESLGLNKISRFAPGGRKRQDSINNALNLVEGDGLILIHDGVRPLVTGGLIERLLKEMDDTDGVIPGIPVSDTLKEVDSGGVVLSTVRRDNFRSIQTPQVFRLQVIKKAYENAYREGFYATDDAALVERAGGRVRVIEGDPVNIKVTTREDMAYAEYILSKRGI
jgi:2-C-methyl-D-erythritol 4-phosphate cytidylyltransferase